MMKKPPRRKNTAIVADWMSEAVLAVESFDSITIARQLMAKHRVNQLPVVEGDTVVGIVTDRDVRDAYPTSMAINRSTAIDDFADTITVEEVMSHNVFTVAPETPLLGAVALLKKQRIGALPVVKKRVLVGIITRSDILGFVLSEANAERGDSRRKQSANPFAARNKRRQLRQKSGGKLGKGRR
jgi:acetoin utilization protein AcuB